MKKNLPWITDRFSENFRKNHPYMTMTPHKRRTTHFQGTDVEVKLALQAEFYHYLPTYAKRLRQIVEKWYDQDVEEDVVDREIIEWWKKTYWDCCSALSYPFNRVLDAAKVKRTIVKTCYYELE